MKNDVKKIITLFLLSVPLLIAVPNALAVQEEDIFIDRMAKFLGIGEHFVKLASHKETAMFFAVEGIVEHYESRGEAAKAIPELLNVLQSYPDNQTIRNIVHFKLRDIYKETGRSDLALKELQAVVAENR